MATVLTPSSQDGTLNGTSEVTLVPAPGSNVQRLVRAMTVENADNQDVVVTVSLANGASRRKIWKGTLNPNDSWQFGESGDVLVLDTTGKSVVAVMGSAPSATNPDFVTSWSDKGTV